MAVLSRGPGDVFESDFLYSRTSDGVVSPSGPYDYFVSHQYEETHTSQTPGYYEKIRNGELIPHLPFYQQKIEMAAGGSFHTTQSNGTVWYNSRPPGTHVTQCRSLDSINDTLATVRSSEWLIQEAASKLYSRSFDALTFFAELAEARRMFKGLLIKFKDTAMRFASSPSDWKRLKLASSVWLEIRFGWRPLILSIMEFEKAYSKIQKKASRLTERCGTEYSNTVVNEYSIPRSDFNSTLVIKDKFTFAGRGTIVADIVSPQFVTNPVVTAWELVPYSFIVDWFLSVGSAIAAASLQLSAVNVSASHGQLWTIERSAFIKDIAPKNDFVEASPSLDFNMLMVVNRRTPAPVPILPHLNIRLDELKIIDLLAIIATKLR